jgi:hypothetical protein
MTKIIDIKSLLIGFLLATSVMLFMGHASSDLLETGRYQVSTTMGSATQVSPPIYETIIDTKTGSIVSRTQIIMNLKGIKKVVKLSP